VSTALANTLAARAFIDELASRGVREVCVAPGSRSTPLVLAAVRDGRLRVRVHLDERSACFFALGVGRASRRPAVVITTSGTAAANLYPAIIESAQAEVPLLALTADRPARLRGTDANQTIDQERLYGVYPISFHEMPPPSSEPGALGLVRATARRAFSEALGLPSGPVHVNFPFDKPLEPPAAEDDAGPEDVEAGWGGVADARGVAARGDADVRLGAARLPAAGALVARLARRVDEVTEGVIVAGPAADPVALGPAVVTFAAASGYPVLADPLSGARFLDARGAVVVAGYDLFLHDERVRGSLRPGLIVRVGQGPTSAALQGFLESCAGVPHVVIDGGRRWKDHAGLATEYVRADAPDTLTRIADDLRTREDANDLRQREGGAWCTLWRYADRVVREALDAAGAAGTGAGAATALPVEGAVARAVLRALPSGAGLFVSSSMPVRDVDAFALPGAAGVTVLANRGASGIDGIVSSAFGVAAASAGPTVCLLGDVAFFHDQNGLLWAREDDAAVVFVVLHNDGGGIFQMLPVRAHEPAFTRCFTAPHGLDFAHTAALHSLAHREVEPPDVGDAVRAALSAGGTHVIVVRTDGAENAAARARVADAVGRRVRRSIGA